MSCKISFWLSSFRHIPKKKKKKTPLSFFGIFCCYVVHTCHYLFPFPYQGCPTSTTCTVTVMRSLWSWAVINSPLRRSSTLNGSGIRRHCLALWSLWVHGSAPTINCNRLLSLLFFISSHAEYTSFKMSFSLSYTELLIKNKWRTVVNALHLFYVLSSLWVVKLLAGPQRYKGRCEGWTWKWH